ncbi:hypothetical protein H0H92_015079 [Tricholoma furcatifolium]|nr:hypothetical protein H0H92_015079 [Tricholoma furcatifolium]
MSSKSSPVIIVTPSHALCVQDLLPTRKFIQIKGGLSPLASHSGIAAMLLLISSILSILVAVHGDDRTTVTLDYGTFNGVRDDSTGIIAFKGIRFADAPIGDLRWKAPVSPPTEHLGIVDASQFGAKCVQTTQTSIVSGYSEDCLFTNVFIPNTTSSEPLPVMVEVSNLELLAEGGDSEGLFHAAMGDSPSLSFFPSYNSAYVEDIFQQFATLAGCESDVMNCLRAAEGNTLALAGSQTIASRTSTLFVFAPILDGSFLRSRPVEAFQSGQFARVPVLFGSNTDEGANWSAMLPDAAANTSMPNATETTAYNFLQGQFASLTRASFDQAVAELYPLSDYGTFSLQGQQMYGEMRYICTAGLITGAAFDYGVKAFQYHYDNPILGSDHGDELTAFFDTVEAGQDVADLFLAMREYWTSFVAAGHPSSSDTPVLWNVSAVAHTTSSPRIFLHPGAIALENLTDALVERCNFWHEISAELNV